MCTCLTPRLVVLQLWDATANRVLREYEEHEKRAWSVDFSKADPQKLASGSDDGTVKLWSINQVHYTPLCHFYNVLLLKSSLVVL